VGLSTDGRSAYDIAQPPVEPSSLIASVILGLSVPAVIACLFVMRPQQVAVMAALGAELFLPEVVAFRFPSVPPLHKHNLPYISLFIGCLLRYPGRVTKLPKERWVLALTAFIVVGAVITALMNQDPLPRQFLTPLPGLHLTDGLFAAAYNFSMTALPFYMGLSLFRTPSDLTTLLAGFSVGALLYIPFELWEMRMSPNLHYKFFGYYQDAFADTRRWGGYRPMVFMKHGLALARFQLIATLAPFVFGNRVRTLLGVPSKLARWVLATMLVLCKSTGAFFYMVMTLPLLLWPKPKRSLRVAMVIGAIVFLYPVLRLTNWFPTKDILDATNAVVGADRTQSVEFRFQNEDKLLAHAAEHPVFGWGQFGRNFTFDRYGKPAVTDGYWIIEFGETGVVGFVAAFGLLLVPIFLCAKRLPSIQLLEDRKLIAGSGLILAIVASDLLPNGLWGLYPYFLAGALTGVTRTLALEPRRDVPVWT